MGHRRALAASGLLALALPALACRDAERQPDLADLVRVLDGRRLVEPRLANDFPHAPCREVPRGSAIRLRPCSPLPGRESRGFRTLLRTVERLKRRVGSPAELHAAGVAWLAGPVPVPGDADAAVRLLGAAAAAKPRDAAIASDLAAAHLVRAATRDDPRDLVHALGRTREALAIDARCREALFNRALALELLGLPGAVPAWQDYLRVETDPAWREEANQHLTHLVGVAGEHLWPRAQRELVAAVRDRNQAGVERLVYRFAGSARLYVEEEVLPEWGRAALEGRQAEAADRLETAAAVSRALARGGGDTLLAETVTAIEEAWRSADAEQLSALAGGLVAYGEGIRVYDPHPLEEARRRLAAAGSPFAGWAELFLAICSYRRTDYGDTLQRLEKLEQETRDTPYRSLHGRVLWIEGLVQTALARPLDALSAYRRSLAAFEAVGDRENVIAVHGMIAESLLYVGAERQGWSHRYSALRGLRELQKPRRRHAVLGEAAMASLHIGEPDAALQFQQEAVWIARRTGDPLELAEALRARSEIELRAGRPAEAVATLQEAVGASRRLNDPALQRAVAGEILDLEGRLRLSSDPHGALRAFSRALEELQATDFRARLADVYGHRAEAWRAVGKPRQAEADLEASLSSVEMEWRQTLEGRGGGGATLGPGYTERRRRLFEAMIRLLVDQERTGEAFDAGEQLHNWDLLDQALQLPPNVLRMSALDAGRALGHAEIAARLPPRVSLVVYVSLEDRLVVWVIRHDRLRMVVRPWKAGDIDNRVARFFASLGTPSRAARRADLSGSLTDLYDLLIHSVRGELGRDDTLVIVPDRSLSAVPFAALRDRVSGRYLIQDYPIILAPSATLSLFAAERDRKLAAGGSGGALILGDPAFERELFPQLRDLQMAAAEAVQIAALYPKPDLFTGATATKDRFLDLAGRRAVVHVAAHALSPAGSPLSSALLLAPGNDEGGSGTLYAHELPGMRFPSTRLVVLSACSSAGVRGARDRRISGFVRPLLAAGVPAVVASLWLVNDRESARLMVDFHRLYRESGDAPSALRAAQLRELARGGSAVETWAAFAAYGAAAAFP